MNSAAVLSEKQQSIARSERRGAYLFSPFIDFMSFGGTSLLLLFLVLLKPADEYRGIIALLMMILSNVINHPHFAHSYQIFYRGFSRKLRDPARPMKLRARYAFAGLVAPALLVVFFAAAISTSNVQLLGYAANIMAFFVGWHYVKQGYGMLMVDCALKRQFFTAAEKRIFLFNSYAVWIYSWISFNSVMKQQDYFGIPFSTFAVPEAFNAFAMAGAIVFSSATVFVLVRKLLMTGALPFNGVLGYGVSLYPWLLFIRVEPLWLLVVPALHSLQYLAVVYRFETNYRRDMDAASLASHDAHAPEGPPKRGRARGLVAFALTGVALGVLGFWILPELMNKYVPYDKSLFGAQLFIFVFWIFINVHHYFIDNVIWRRDNEEAQRYLFAARQA